MPHSRLIKFRLHGIASRTSADLASVDFASVAISAVVASILTTSSICVNRASAQDAASAQASGRPVRSRLIAQAKAGEPTLEEIINNTLTAYGGKPALAQVSQKSTALGEQRTLADSNNSTSYKLSLKDEKFRIDFNDSNGTVDESGTTTVKANHTAIGFDGRRSWQVKGKESPALAADEFQAYKNEAQRQPFLLTHYQEPGYTFTFLGRTNYKQTPVFGISVVSANDPGETTMFIDPQNFQVVAITSSTKSGATPTTVEYSQYRPVGGTLWPFKQVKCVGDSDIAETDLKSVDLTTEIPDTVFASPSSGAVVHLSKEVAVPFDYAQKEIVIKGHLNTSEELEFLFDTGASDTLIDRRVAAEHFLPKDGSFSIASMSGVVNAENSLVKRLELGKLIVNDVPVRILDLSGQSKHLGRPIAGIVGMNVISRYLVSLDYSKPSITFADVDDGVRPNVKAVAFVKNDAPYVSASLNGREPCTFLVDTGAAFNHMPESFARHFVTGDAAGKHFVEGTGLDGQPVRLGTVILDNVILGGFAAKRTSFTYPAKVESASAGPQSKQAAQKGGFFQDVSSGILGNPFWQNFIITIDSKYQRLFLRNNPGFSARDAIQRALSTGDAALTLHREYREAEFNYQKGLMVAESTNDPKERARLLGRLGNLRRLMAKDLKRPEHAKASYDYFTKAEELAQKGKSGEVEGRILADWSLLYADNGQQQEARTTMERGLALASDDPNVNVDIAVHLYRAGQFPEMQKYVEKALFLDPDNWQALWYQVKLSENFNDTPRVVATLKDIARYYPWSKVAKDKLAAILTRAAAPAGTPPGAAAPGAIGAPGANGASLTPGATPPRPAASASVSTPALRSPTSVSRPGSALNLR